MTNLHSYIIILFVAGVKHRHDAEVAELADAHGSGPCGSNTVRVQVPSSALQLARRRETSLRLFCILLSQARAAALLDSVFVRCIHGVFGLYSVSVKELLEIYGYPVYLSCTCSHRKSELLSLKIHGTISMAVLLKK